MSKLMQLPTLFLRGAIATQTMNNLTEEDCRRINSIVKEIEKDQALAADKHEFMRQLGATIKSDYRSDSSTAEQEFRIAIWRATVHLIYHRDYSYSCSICGATEYRTCTDKMKPIDRQSKVCPNCSQTYFGPNQTLARLKSDDDHYWLVAADDPELPYSDKFKLRIEAEKLLTSPIIAIQGSKKVDNPDEILADPVQRGKWYTVWIWNYFRQILNENIIRTHNKHQVQISGPADLIAFQAILSELRRYKYKHNYDESAIHGSGAKDVTVNLLATEPEISTNFLGPLIREYKGHNVAITVCQDDNTISVRPSGSVAIIDAVIETEDPVMMLSFAGPTNDEEEGRGWGDIMDYNSGCRIYDGEIERVVADDAMSTVRSALKDSRAKQIFDILSQTGENWNRFSEQWGPQQPKKAHIARHLNVSVKQVDAYRQLLMTQCIVHSLKKGDLQAISDKELESKMRKGEEEHCNGFKTKDILGVCILYRFLCRSILRANHICRYDELPERLRQRVERSIYNVLQSRVSKFIRD